MLSRLFQQSCAGQRVGSYYLGVSWECHSALQAWTPGVTWSVTCQWCYLECYNYLVLPERCLALPGVFISEYFFCAVPKYPLSSNSNFSTKNQFSPRDVTWAHACSRYLFTWPTLWRWPQKRKRITTESFYVPQTLPAQLLFWG